MDIEIKVMVPGYYRKTKLSLIDNSHNLIGALRTLSTKEDFDKLVDNIIVDDKIAKGINIFINGYSIRNHEIYKELQDNDDILIIPYVSGG